MAIGLNHLDVYPDKAQYRPGDKGNIIIEIETDTEATLTARVQLKDLVNILYEAEQELLLTENHREQIQVPFKAGKGPWQCVGVDIKFYKDGELLATKSTAFDVVDHWRRAPRYGFLSDFSEEELGNTRDVSSLSKFHINIIQFYDWMYRHDNLVPPSAHFVDPMGRKLSYEVITEKRLEAHKKGTAAIAYGAVYASLKDYYEAHKELALYKRNDEPFSLIDRFYIMDISPDSAWTEKIIAEFIKVIYEGFDGIHLDQYGFPKKALRRKNGKDEVVDLAPCYRALIDRLKQEIAPINSEAGLIFNNVSNYPVEVTAKADQEAIYIEVWPPVNHFYELKQLIDRGRELSGKQVILSAYLPAFRKLPAERINEAENGALLTMSTIFACGGYHFLLGEENSALTAAYYPDYARLRDSFIGELRHYYDFIVRYGKLLYSFDLRDVSMTYTGGVNTEVQFTFKSEIGPNGDVNTIWSIVKNSSQYMILHLINLVGLENDIWESGKKKRPTVQRNVVCTALMEHEVERLFLASPEANEGRPTCLDYDEVIHEQGRAIKFVIPELKIWDMVVIKWKSEFIS